MRKLLKYLKKCWIFALLAPLCMMLEATMDLYQPTLMAEIIDVGVANGDLNYVLSIGGKMLLFSFVGMIGGILCTVFSSIASSRFAAELRKHLFAKIQKFSFAEIDKLKTSSLITRVTNDVTQMQHMVLMSLRIMVRSPLLFAGGVVMAIRLSPKLSTLFIFMVPLIVVTIFFVISWSFPLFSVLQRSIDRVNTVMRENLLGVKVVKAFVGRKQETNRFKTANEDLKAISIKSQMITILMWPIVNIIMQFAVVAVLWFGGKMFTAGDIKTGEIMAFINYLTQIMFSLTMSVMLFINFSRAKVSADRINQVFETAPSVTDLPDALDLEGHDVEFKNVYFKYHSSGQWVLEDISFKVNAGETVGIIGSTGSGKSTLAMLIPRLYDVTEGEILIGGKPVRNLKTHSLRDNTSVVLQESILFSGTIEDNLRQGKENATEEDLHIALDIAQASEFVNALPDGILSPVEQRGKNFSGGQKQRLSIARSLVRNPKILILDDASSALDMATEAKLQTALKENITDCTTFIIAQRISGVMYCDKILVLDDGKISGIGNHLELLKSNEIYRSIVISQLGEEAVING
ncbi:MAG: ABC transporter ATP-binding protein [Clostridia bacterium]|nr:ABC transporter ATP-binding protein [Clostridia bacterium]